MARPIKGFCTLVVVFVAGRARPCGAPVRAREGAVEGGREGASASHAISPDVSRCEGLPVTLVERLGAQLREARGHEGVAVCLPTLAREADDAVGDAHGSE